MATSALASSSTPATRCRAQGVLRSLIDDESQIMRTNRLLRPSGAAAALLVSLYAAAASAQYPSRPIRLLVPNPPGRATATISRVVAPRLREVLRPPVVVRK